MKSISTSHLPVAKLRNGDGPEIPVNRHSHLPEHQPGPVTLNGDEWQEVVRLLDCISKIAGTASQRRHFILDEETLTRRARQAFIDRRKRVTVFGSGMFGEPAWDMLLILYSERHLQRRTIGRLADFIGAAPTTVLRWVNVLEERGLIRRTEHPTDGRAAYVELSDKAETALNSYFSETPRR